MENNKNKYGNSVKEKKQDFSYKEEEKKEESKEEVKKNIEDVFNIEEFCSLKNLNKYYLDSLKMSFGMEVKKTVKQWKEILLKNKLIKEHQIK